MELTNAYIETSSYHHNRCARSVGTMHGSIAKTAHHLYVEKSIGVDVLLVTHGSLVRVHCYSHTSCIVCSLTVVLSASKGGDHQRS